MKGENHMLKMDIEYTKGILFVRLKGILNYKNSYKINNYINPVIKKHQIKYMVYNLGLLEDIDEEGIDAILNSKIEIKKNKGKIILCKVNQEINKKINRLKITKVNNEALVRKEV